MTRTAWRLVSTGLLLASTAMAHSVAAPGGVVFRSETVTMNGEIIDPQCYFTHNSRGTAHASCATMCAKGGQGLAFLDDASGVVYQLIAKKHGASQNEGVIPYIGKPVRVNGMIYHYGINAVLRVTTITDRAAIAKRRK